jgi:hypothetical protein
MLNNDSLYSSDTYIIMTYEFEYDATMLPWIVDMLRDLH